MIVVPALTRKRGGGGAEPPCYGKAGAVQRHRAKEGRGAGHPPADRERVGDRPLPAAGRLRPPPHDHRRAGRLPVRGGKAARGDRQGAGRGGRARGVLVPALREPKARYAPPRPFSGSPSRPSLSERDLAHLWEGQRFPPQALASADGQPLIVLYRGLRGRGPGPDFRDAVIQTPGGTLRGDVELHLRASDFRRHGHDRDPAYDGLALHLVFWADEGPHTLLAGGRRVPLAALAPWLERRSGEIRRWLERPALWREPCRSAPSRLGDAAVAAVLDRLGDIRFRRRTAELRRALRGEEAEEVLYRALMEALGYGGNREAFGLLALRLPWRGLRRSLATLPAGERGGAALEMMLEAATQPPG